MRVEPYGPGDREAAAPTGRAVAAAIATMAWLAGDGWRPRRCTISELIVIPRAATGTTATAASAGR